MNQIIKDETVLWFGKHIGKTPVQIVDVDSSYLRWLMDTESFETSFSQELISDIEFQEEQDLDWGDYSDTF